MGFPVGYSEMPRVVVHLLFLLSHLRRISSWLTGLDIWDAADHHRSPCRLLEEQSPAVRFDSLSGGRGSPHPDAGCAVCLGDFHGAAEVRRARGCRHVFHRDCLDRWAEHGHHTCPLCRSPLLLLPPSC